MIDTIYQAALYTQKSHGASVEEYVDLHDAFPFSILSFYQVHRDQLMTING